MYTQRTPHIPGRKGLPRGGCLCPSRGEGLWARCPGKEASLRQGTELGVFVTSALTYRVSHRTRCGRGSRPLLLPGLGGLGWSPCDLVCRPPDNGQHFFWERIQDTVQLVSLAPWGRGWLASLHLPQGPSSASARRGRALARCSRRKEHSSGAGLAEPGCGTDSSPPSAGLPCSATDVLPGGSSPSALAAGGPGAPGVTSYAALAASQASGS